MPQYPPASDCPETAAKYDGKCHCGAVSFTINLPKPLQLPDTDGPRPSYAETSLAECPVYKVNQCNCSACYKLGYVLVYPYRRDVQWHTGYPDALKGYRFATKRSEHLFCTTCGTSMVIDFHLEDSDQDQIAINAKLLKGVDLEKCEWRYFEGKTKLNPEVNDVTW